MCVPAYLIYYVCIYIYIYKIYVCTYMAKTYIDIPDT